MANIIEIRKNKLTTPPTTKKYLKESTELEFVVAFETDDDEEPPPLYTFEINKQTICLTTIDNYTLLSAPTYFVRYSDVNDISYNSTSASYNTCTITPKKFETFLKNIIKKALNALNKVKTIGCNLKSGTCANELFLKTNYKGIQRDTTIVSKKPDQEKLLNYWNSTAFPDKNNIIKPNINLIMRYWRQEQPSVSGASTNYKYFLDFGYIYIKSTASLKKSLMTDAMQKIINNKLAPVPPYVAPSCVKELVTLPLPSQLVANIGNAVLEIYTTNLNNTTINSTELAKLRGKPYTLLESGKINTYLNVFLSMLDKPHDIIGKRVTTANQELLMTNVIIPNIENYMEYLNNIDDQIIKNFIIFVKTMLKSFEKPSKNYKVISYENAILYLICKHYSTPPYSSTTSINFDLKSLDQQAPPAPTNNNIVINPDIMNLTTEINNIANQYNNKKIRQYFSVPEVIDHGHVYDIDSNTIIEFPENYKEIQLPFNTANPSSKYITIHSYSTTTNEDLTNPKLYYNIYVWFTKTDTSVPVVPAVPFCLIKYKIPFDKAPDCATVYSSYCANILTSNKFNEIKNLLDAAINSLSLTDDVKMIETIKCLILDQIFNAKSLQDDQNQLQVNQLQTSAPVPDPVPPGTHPTQFIGLCTDLASAANGINYYMSQPNRNQNSIVAYYYKTKKIWANKSQIYFYFEGPPANKAAAKDIYNIIVTASTSGGGGDKRKRDEKGREDDFKMATIGNYKRTQDEEGTEYEQTYIEKDSNMNTDTNENYYNIDTGGEDNDTEFIETQYNIMYDILYEKISEDNISKNNNLKLNVPDNNSKYNFDVLFKCNEKGHYKFEIFSNNFIHYVILLFEQELKKEKLILPLNEFIKRVVEYLLNSDTTISPDNAFGENRSIEGQIELSNKLDIKYLEVKQKYIEIFNNQQDSNYSDVHQNKFYKRDDGNRGTGILVHGGSKSNKKRTNKKRTNKKRTNKKKIKRTIRKTKKHINKI